jgi:hypothetical protein
MIEMGGQGESLGLQGAIGFDVVHKGYRTLKSLLQPRPLQLSGTLEPP